LKLDERLSLSPSDLSAFLACEHLTALDLRAVRRALERPVVEDPTAKLIRRKGEEHEARYLAELRAAGRIVLEIPFDHDWAAAACATEETIRLAEADVIFQGCLVDGDWRGFADFLESQDDGLLKSTTSDLILPGSTSDSGTISPTSVRASIGSPSSSSAIPVARCAAAGAKMSRSRPQRRNCTEQGSGTATRRPARCCGSA
jgi:hypothetical protein